MKFSVKVQYGLQAMFELALRSTSGSVQIREIAKAQNIPIRFLEQLLLLLKKRGLVISNRGKLGGYSLSKHASDITLLDVIEAFEGEIELISNKLKKSPILFNIFKNLEDKIKNDFKEITLEDLVFRKRQKERALIYNI